MFKDFSTDDVTWPPKFTKFILHFNDEHALAFTDPRRFAKMRLQTNPESQAPILGLGFDPLHSMPTLDVFLGILGKRQGPIKSVLLDQAFCAGIGNWVADEVFE